MEYGPLLYLIQNMREADRTEIFATSFLPSDGSSDHDYAVMILECAKTGAAFIAFSGEEPVAVLGMSLMWPGNASVWMFATPRWLSVRFGLTRFAKQTIISVMNDSGIHRAQCWSMETHRVAHRWLESLGATYETMAPAFGKNGEDFSLFAWVKGRDF